MSGCVCRASFIYHLIECACVPFLLHSSQQCVSCITSGSVRVRRTSFICDVDDRDTRVRVRGLCKTLTSTYLLQTIRISTTHTCLHIRRLCKTHTCAYLLGMIGMCKPHECLHVRHTWQTHRCECRTSMEDTHVCVKLSYRTSIQDTHVCVKPSYRTYMADAQV